MSLSRAPRPPDRTSSCKSQGNGMAVKGHTGPSGQEALHGPNGDIGLQGTSEFNGATMGPTEAIPDIVSTSQGQTEPPIIEGSITVSRQPNITSMTLPRPSMRTFKGPSNHKGPQNHIVVTCEPGHRRTKSAVLMTSSLDRRLIHRPTSLVVDPGPWEPMPDTALTKLTTEGPSSDEEQASPTEDMPIGRPIIQETEPPDFDDSDPSITWYGKTIVRCAFPIVVIITAIQITLALCLVFLAPWPSFDNPTMDQATCWYLTDEAGESVSGNSGGSKRGCREGFEARGTSIKGRASSWWKYQASIAAAAEVINNVTSAAGQIARPPPPGCAINGSDIFNIVVESGSSRTLWNAEAVRDMCALEGNFYEDSVYVNHHCKPVSLGHQIALLRDKTCAYINDIDMREILSVLLNCSYYYNIHTLHEDCTPMTCPHIPHLCTKHGAVYRILHYLTDVNFMSSTSHLQYSNLPIPLLPQQNVMNFYLNEIQKKRMNTDAIHIAGIDAVIKNDLFNRLLLLDLVYFTLAMELIVIISGLYLRSVIVTIALIFDVIFTLILALFVYFIAIGMEFFPFINLLSGVVIIALAADDVFLFHQSLTVARSQRPEASKAAWVSYAMNHAGVSIFTTSFTTSAAFASNFVSQITAIKCFSIFASISIICNFLLMMTLIPAVFALVITSKPSAYSKCTSVCRIMQRFYATCRHASDTFFGDIVAGLIDKAWFVWIFLFLALGIGGIIVMFAKPKLELPTNSVIQAFASDDPVERYDNDFRDVFRYQLDMLAELNNGLPLAFVWGLEEKDNGDYLNPSDNGSLVFDDTFMLDAPASQIFLMKFCRDVRTSSFTSQTMSKIPCTLDLFEASMTQPCNVTNKSQCCSQHPAPYSSFIFHKCFPLFYETKILEKDTALPLGVPYFKQNHEVEVFTINVVTKQSFTTGYKPMKELFQNISAFFQEQLLDAPHGARLGWFTSLLSFFDAQRALVTDTPIAVGVSLAVSFVVTFLTTRSFLLTFFAMLTISLVIFVTIGSLVLLQWKLNALESIIISLAVGISIDFTIHYGVAFRLCKASDRASRMRLTLTSVGAPVAMAAFTTFCAGAAIMPCDVRGYQQLGTFLMLVMVCSWVYSTLFFMSLCRFAGPQGKSTCSASCFKRSCCCCSSSCSSQDEDERNVTSEDSNHTDVPHLNHYHHPPEENHVVQKDICMTVYQNSAVKEADEV